MDINIPKEIWIEIFGRLPILDLTSVTRVCKLWNSLAFQSFREFDIWNTHHNNFIQQDFPIWNPTYFELKNWSTLLSNCSNLTRISLTRTLLEDDHLLSLVKLPLLEDLDLSLSLKIKGNNFDSFPKLKRLSLRGCVEFNSLNHLPSSLEILEIVYCNQLSQLSQAEFLESLASHPKLMFVDATGLHKFTPQMLSNYPRIAFTTSQEPVPNKICLFQKELKRITEELIMTEFSFLRAMQTLVDIKKQTQHSTMLPPDKMGTLFYNKDRVFFLHSAFCLNVLRAASEDEILIWKQFQFLLPYQWMILESAGLPAMQVCDEEQSRPEFASFLQDVKMKYLKLDLSSYLVTPIARFPRYMLLLKDFKKSNPGAVDDVIEALSPMLDTLNRMYGTKSQSFAIIPMIRNLKIADEAKIVNGLSFKTTKYGKIKNSSEFTHVLTWDNTVVLLKHDGTWFVNYKIVETNTSAIAQTTGLLGTKTSYVFRDEAVGLDIEFEQIEEKAKY